jgi:hypothetical protein
MPEKKRVKRVPSVAFIATVLIGLAFTAFSVLESFDGFISRPIKLDAAIGGLMQILAFGLPFFIVAWLLWYWPRIGGAILLLMGLGFAVWMHFGMGRPDWIVTLLLIGVPILLGLLTIIWPGKSMSQRSPEI